MVFDKRGTPKTELARPMREVLRDKAGSGIADGLGGIAILVMLASMVSLGITQDMKAVQTLSVKAERQELVTSLVDDKRQGATWGTPAAPTTQMMTLKNGSKTAVTLWKEKTAVGTSLTAVTSTSADADAADCTKATAVEKPGCIYAYRFHAGDMNSINPDISIRKNPSTNAAGVIGTVDARVSTSASIPQGTVFATGKDTKGTAWRYLITAKSLESSGEIRISQAGKILAVIPVGSEINNYFGTFSAETNVPVTVAVVQGNVIVQTVMTYRAGGTS